MSAACTARVLPYERLRETVNRIDYRVVSEIPLIQNAGMCESGGEELTKWWNGTDLRISSRPSRLRGPPPAADQSEIPLTVYGV